MLEAAVLLVERIVGSVVRVQYMDQDQAIATHTTTTAFP